MTPLTQATRRLIYFGATLPLDMAAKAYQIPWTVLLLWMFAVWTMLFFNFGIATATGTALTINRFQIEATSGFLCFYYIATVVAFSVSTT